MLRRFEQFCNSTFSIYRSVLKIERTEMEKFGLKGPHAQCLLAMARYPDGITAAQLCVHCDKDKAAISRTVAELEAAEMLTREGSGKNGYRAQLKLTDKGFDAASRVAERAKCAVERAGSGLTDEQRAVFYYAMGLIADNLQNICEEGLHDHDDFNEVTE